MINKQKKDWEKEFDKEFKDSFEGGDMHSWERAEPIKQFISSQLGKVRKETIEEIRSIKKHYHFSVSLECPKCMEFGTEGDKYCPNDRRKYIEKKEKWESDEDEAYNQAIDDILSKLNEKETK